MKQLWIVRHAKSDWNHPGLPDFERPLNQQGLRDAPAMGAWLGKQDVDPQALLCSPALRARQTAEQIARGIGFPVGRIQFEARIYEATAETLVELISQVDAGVERFMLVGHNPGMTRLFYELGGGPLDNLPTCAVASMAYDSDDWSLAGRKPVEVDIWQPREVLG